MTVDLRTRYLGLDLRSPLVASASPMTGDPGTARQLEDAGAAAIVLPSLFEEEILHDELALDRSLDAGTEQFAEALGYFPTLGDESFGVGDRYLTGLERIKAGASIPVVASLNATTPGGWVRYARWMQDAGADALELNLYHLATDPTRTAGDLEETDLDMIASVRASVTIPLAVKLSPYYSSFANFATRVADAGADGLVLFNRFYQPDLDLDTLDVQIRLDLSQPWELRLPLRWIAILRPQLRTDLSFAATSGIASGTDALKALMVGADVTMMTSALLRQGPSHLARVELELRRWMEDHEYESVEQLKGSVTHASGADPAAFERANYRRTLHSWSSPERLDPVASR